MDYSVVLGGDGVLDWSFVWVVSSADQRCLFVFWSDRAILTQIQLVAMARLAPADY